MKLLPGLPNFVKSNQVVQLEPCKFDIYKLKKIEKTTFKGIRTTQLIFTYKIKKTHYTIYSTKSITNKNTRPVFEDGFIVLSKGFKKYRLELKDLNSNLSNSICKNMDRFNEFIKSYNQSLVDDEQRRKKAKILSKQEKIDNFIKGLDF
jgi:hypothetical protein